MIVTRKHLSRRALLRGAGTAIALPWLDAMRPAFAKAADPPRRLAFIYIPNGVTMADWIPSAEIPTPRILQPLTPLRGRVRVIRGLAHHNADALGDGAGDHARASACFLTGVHPRKTAARNLANGISADQIAAAHLRGVTRFPSLELGCEDSRTVGDCDSGYSCAYTNSIAWRGEATPLPPETNPRLAFERLFGDEDLTLDPAARARRDATRRSILDLAQDDTRRLSSALGPGDRRKLDEYLDALREIERRIQQTATDRRPFTPDLEKPPGVPFYFSGHLRLMYDLLAAAFQSDQTRVCTLMTGREGSVRTYPEIGVPEQHHPLTHHRNDPALIEKVTKINCFHTEQFAYFLRKLAASQEGDGTLLDRSMIVYASAISDGNEHSHYDLPVLLAGPPGGRDVVCPNPTPMTNLYIALLDKMGVPAEKIGDSTGRLGVVI